MGNLDRAVDQELSHSAESSFGRFFDDAYNQGVVKAISQHPKEAATVAAATVVAAGALAAGVYLTKGRSLAGEGSLALRPATESLVHSSLPITMANREAAMVTMHLSPWERASAIQSLAPQLVKIEPGKALGFTTEALTGKLVPPLHPIEIASAVRNHLTENLAAKSAARGPLSLTRQRNMLHIFAHEVPHRFF